MLLAPFLYEWTSLSSIWMTWGTDHSTRNSQCSSKSSLSSRGVTYQINKSWNVHISVGMTKSSHRQSFSKLRVGKFRVASGEHWPMEVACSAAINLPWVFEFRRAWWGMVVIKQGPVRKPVLFGSYIMFMTSSNDASPPGPSLTRGPLHMTCLVSPWPDFIDLSRL